LCGVARPRRNSQRALQWCDERAERHTRCRPCACESTSDERGALPDRDHAVELLDSGTVDAAIGVAPTYPDGRILTRPILKDEFVTIVASEHPAARRGSMDMKTYISILVIGSAGMIGRKLVERIVRDGHLGGRRLGELVLADVVPTEMPANAPANTRVFVTDISVAGAAAELVKSRPQVIFHLAAIVSGEAEADFDKGYRINFDGTRALFEAIRQEGYVPRLVFTSSIAVFGAPFPESIPDTFFTTPLTSYGTQKAMVELLLADYSRRGFLDGVGIRLPTISIRPGKPNRAASGFYSSILREPLNGEEAVLPVDESMRHWFASPRAAIGFLIHAANIDSATLGARRTLTMPGLSATVADQLAALQRVGGDAALALVTRAVDSTIERIVTTWPHRFDTPRARALGFVAESTFDEIIAVYMEDEMGKG
jgi:D-erythronate 2-dehydrogenase